MRDLPCACMPIYKDHHASLILATMLEAEREVTSTCQVYDTLPRIPEDTIDCSKYIKYKCMD